MDSLANFNVAVRIKDTDELTIEQIRGIVTSYAVGLFESGIWTTVGRDVKILLCGVDSVEVVRDDEELNEFIKDVDDFARDTLDRCIVPVENGEPGDVCIYDNGYDDIHEARRDASETGLAKISLLDEFCGQKMAKIRFVSGKEVLLNADVDLVARTLSEYY